MSTRRVFLLSSLSVLGGSLFVGSAGCDGATPIGDSAPIPDSTPPMPLALMQVTNQSVGLSMSDSISIEAGRANIIVGAFSLLSQGDTTITSRVILTIIGSIAKEDIANIRLMAGTTLITNIVTRLMSNQVILDFNTPLTQPAGQTLNLTVYADIISGVGRYVQLAILNALDISVKDANGTTILPILNTGDFPLQMSYIILTQGSLTVLESPAFIWQTATAGKNNQLIGWFKFVALGEAVRITSVALHLAFGDGLTESDLSNLKFTESRRAFSATVPIVPTNNPRILLTNLNYVVPTNGIYTIYIIANVRDGAKGTVQTSLSGIQAQGFTSLASFQVSDATGHVIGVE